VSVVTGVKRGKSCRAGQGQIAEALQRIESVEELIAQLHPGEERLPLKERCEEALALTENPPAI